MRNRPHTSHAIVVLFVCISLSGCTTTYVSVSGSPAIVRAIDKVIPRPIAVCSTQEVVTLSLHASQTYTYRSDERGQRQWTTLMIDRNGTCTKFVSN